MLHTLISFNLKANPVSELKCIIVEDEPLAVKVLADFISQVPYLELSGSFKNALLASQYLHNQSVDLMFLDIHLPKLKGMAFLRTLRNPPMVIITSAYHQYALQSYEFDVKDYLLKPFGFERFLRAVNKVRAAQKETSLKTSDEKDYLFVNCQQKKVKILFSDIIYVESKKEYISIVTSRKQFLCKMSTHEFEKLLPPHLFKRVHRSFIVSVKKIESYNAEMMEVGGIAIPIGRAYRDSIDNL